MNGKGRLRRYFLEERKRFHDGRRKEKLIERERGKKTKKN